MKNRRSNLLIFLSLFIKIRSSISELLLSSSSEQTSDVCVCAEGGRKKPQSPQVITAQPVEVAGGGGGWRKDQLQRPSFRRGEQRSACVVCVLLHPAG